VTSVDLPPPFPPPEHDPVDAAAREDLRGLFELEQVLRRGPTSLVCLARDLEYNQPVALKVMPRAAAAGPDAEEAFHRAAALAAALDHPHIVPLYSAGATDRFFWCAMQYVEGRSLAELLRSGGPMEPAVCLRLVGQVATALDSAHRLGVVHGCLTPANVLLDTAGDAHVSDFWIPWVLERLGALRGDSGKARRVRYRAPEQVAEGRCGPEADQHALATLMQACLIKTPARVPPEIGRAIERAASPVPEDRFPNVRDFAIALGAGDAPARGVPGALVGYQDADFAESTPMPPRWGWVPAGVFTLVVLGAVAAPWLLSHGSGRDHNPESEAKYSPPPADSLTPPDSEPFRKDSVGVVPPTSPPLSPPRRAPARALARAPKAVAADGHLFINSTPWGEVWWDGNLLGNTPLVNLPTSPGSHRLRVVRDGFQPYEIAILVQPGQTLRLTDIVLKEVTP